MKKLYNLALIFFLLMAQSAWAQQSMLQGTVTDLLTDKPIEGASIVLGENQFTTRTDTNGFYAFLSVPAGKISVTISAENYQTRVIKLDVSKEVTLSFDIQLATTVINLPDLVVTAEAPVSAASSQLLNSIDFQLRPRNSAQDMLKLVPGLFIAQHAGGGKAEQIFVRGFDCDHGTDIATYVDGVPVNMPSHGHGQGYADLHFLIPEVVKQMAVSKGPYFAENGDFSTGATVRFETLDRLEQNTFTTEISSVPTQRALSGSRALLMMQLPFEPGNLNAYIAGDFIYAPSYFDLSQQFRRFSVFNKNVYRFSDKTTLSLSFNSFGSSWNASGQVPERAVEEGLISRFGAIDSMEGGQTSRSNLNLELASKIGGNDFHSQIFFSDYRFRLFSDFTFFLNDPVHGDMIEQTDDRHMAGYNGFYTVNGKLGNRRVQTKMGFGFRSDRTQVMLWHSPDRMRLHAMADAVIFERNMNGWLKEIVSISPRWKAELGLRMDYFTFDVDDRLPVDSTHRDQSGVNYQSLLQPKFNLTYSPADEIHFFLNSGIGFHSNDARAVVQDFDQHRLPLAAGGELGTQLQSTAFVISVACWVMELENELVYIGDEGTTEDAGASSRMGVDFSARYRIFDWLYADADVNLSRGVLLNRFLGEKLPQDQLIPLAPRITSTGGLTAARKQGWQGSIRYRFMGDRPANESNTVIAKGYFLMDAAVGYGWKKMRLGVNIENLTNATWNEAQFDTESRLFDEAQPIAELHFTPGTPFALKAIFSINF